MSGRPVDTATPVRPPFLVHRSGGPKKGNNVNTQKLAQEQLDHPRSQSAFRSIRILVGGYVAISLATLIAIVLLRNHASIVNSAVWIRGTIVVASALLTLSFAARAARGSRGGYRRLRIISIVMVVAIAAIISLPGTFPLWMKLEQGVCGLLLIGVAVIVNGRHMRSLFTAK